MVTPLYIYIPFILLVGMGWVERTCYKLTSCEITLYILTLVYTFQFRFSLFKGEIITHNVLYLGCVISLVASQSKYLVLV